VCWIKQYFLFFTVLILCGCARDAMDPLSLAPQTHFSTWTKMGGNNLVSSQYCQILLPPSFGEEEMNLAELVDIALLNNTQTRVTWAQARAAAASYGQSLSGFYPIIYSSTQFVRQKSGFPSIQQPLPQPQGATAAASNAALSNLGTTIPGAPTFYSTQVGPDVTLSYVLFDFGQRTAAALAAREALYYADLNHNQEIQTVLQTVMNDYYAYIYQLKALESDEANLETAQMSLDAANEKFALGLAALGDVATARTQFLQTRMALTSQKQAVENAFAKLAVDIGLPANIKFRVQPMPDHVVPTPILESVNELVCIAQNQRQDLKAAEANVRSHEALVLCAKRAVLPVLSTTLETGHYWFQKGLQEKGMHWQAALALQFPIFDGYYYKNGVRSAEANLEASKAQLFQAELSMIQHVTTAHMGVKTAALNLSDADDYLESAKLEFKIALANYQAGTKAILDVLSAQSSLADARTKRAQAQQSWFNSIAAIAYATGSLCATPNEVACCSN
jgi:outer membrane protein